MAREGGFSGIPTSGIAKYYEEVAIDVIYRIAFDSRGVGADTLKGLDGYSTAGIMKSIMKFSLLNYKVGRIRPIFELHEFKE